MTPAQQIREARGGLSRTEAARRTGIPLDTLDSWESGRRTPKPYTLPGILQALRDAQSSPARSA